jgi:hypothetical protein
MDPPKNHHRARGTRLPLKWELPEDLKAWAIKDQPTWDGAHALRVAENFRDYWVSVAGARGVKLDWAATWRTWVRKEGPKPVPRGATGSAAMAWRAGAEPTEVLKSVAERLGIDPWDGHDGETHGQFRRRIIDAGGEELLKPPGRAVA